MRRALDDRGPEERRIWKNTSDMSRDYLEVFQTNLPS